MSNEAKLHRKHRHSKTNKVTSLIRGRHSGSKSKNIEQKTSISKSKALSPNGQTNQKNLKVQARLIAKKFELSQNEKLKELLGIGKKSREMKDFWALRNVNFEVFDGEAIGIIGLNGSGKSTLLNMIDKSLSITTGELTINGEVSHIAIGAGLKPDLTGRDNIRLKATMMGMTKQEIEDKMDEIVQFSELGPFIDRQVKDYSSGMRSKLAFSIAVNQDPDILIIDEALSVGDSTFAAKSSKKMFEFRERGKTIFVVSHSVDQIRNWTDKVLWLHYGEVKEYGATKDILPKYQTFIRWFNGLSKEQQEQYKLDRRQEQLDYSVEALKQEILDNSPQDLAQTELTIIDETMLKSKNKAKLPIMSQIVMGLCFVFMLFNIVVLARSGDTQTLTSDTKLPPQSSSKSQSSSQSNRSTSASKSSTSSSQKSSSKSTETFNYVVQDGDTLGGIAAAYGLATDEILKLNPGLDPSLITVGMTIKLPKSVEGMAGTQENPNTTTADDTNQNTPIYDGGTTVPSYESPAVPLTPETPPTVETPPSVETPPTVETPPPTPSTPDTPLDSTPEPEPEVPSGEGTSEAG